VKSLHPISSSARDLDQDERGSPMDAEVFWHARRVGILRGVRVDQPYYLREWAPADDPEFAAGLAAQNSLPVEFRSPDGAITPRRGRSSARLRAWRSPSGSVEARAPNCSAGIARFGGTSSGSERSTSALP